MHQTMNTLERAGIAYVLSLDGRIYFPKAKDRDRAARIIDLQDPQFKPMPVIARREQIKDPSELKYHWKDSRCTKVHYRYWKWATRERVLDGAQFDLLLPEQRCPACSFEFENA